MQYDPDLIVTMDNRNAVISALIAWGHSAASVMIKSNVQLANLYHESGPTQNDPRGSITDIIQTATSRAIIETMSALINGKFDRATIAEVVREELEQRPPARIEIVTPHGTTVIDGTVHYRTEMVLRIASLGHAIMLVGPAGCGKTTIGEHVARALGLHFYITSTINDTHELIGFVDGHGQYHSTPFRHAFQHGGLWIADEIDAWDASALLTANSALANGYCTFPDIAEPIARHANFRMVATANTFGTGADRVYVGRNELDAASLDRFAVIEVDYDLTLERMFSMGNDRWLNRVWDVRKTVADKRIRHVVSSRAIGMGATALAAGIAWDDVETIYLMKGISSKDRKKIEDSA